MHLSTDFIDVLANKLGDHTKIASVAVESGGDINKAYKLQTSRGDYFLKCNFAEKYPNMFNYEADALQKIGAVDGVEVPEVIATGVFQKQSYLLLEYTVSGEKSDGFWKLLGDSLASLHKVSSSEFGLNHSNYIGSLEQSNSRKSCWNDFFIEERLLPQIKISRDNGLMKRDLSNAFDRFFPHLESIIPVEKPALLHGDLWSGNIISNCKNSPVLIDPSIYFGHREMDIAMSKLFGGFYSAFYESYNNSFSLEKGWQQRVEYHNLYPLLVHLNLFGATYLSPISGILKPF